MTDVSTPGRFAGVVKIVRFNVQFYLLSIAALTGIVLLVASRKLPHWGEVVVLSGASIGVFWTLSSLFVSWYVYDYAAVTRWQWLPGRLPAVPRRWANIHAGLDESTSELRRLFPGSVGFAVDIYDPEEMTEPSIARARKIQPAREPFKRGTYDALPLPENGCDAVFLLFSAHEVRATEHRMSLLRQTVRALDDQGCVVLVEHLRDWKNFLAFGPGFLHFHSRRSWLRTIHDAGLAIVQEGSITPFVTCFVLCRSVR